MKYDKAKAGEDHTHSVETEAKCKTMCEKWGETNTGEKCYGIEVKKVGENDFDYCEIWLSNPAGKTDSTDHKCDLWVPVQVTGTGTNEGDVSSATALKALTAFAAMALTYGTV